MAMNRVSFGMFWQSYGRQDIELPDHINPHDREAVIEYIRSRWNEISIPEGEYVANSDELDEESEIEIYSVPEDEEIKKRACS